jgi:hypothetical protein
MAVAVLKKILPDADWLLKRCTSSGEWLRFPPEFVDLLKRLNVMLQYVVTVHSDSV